MALADTAKLVASLELQDKFTKPLAGAMGGLDAAGRKIGTLGQIGNEASRGLGTAAHNIGLIGLAAGAVAVGGIAASVKAAGDFEAALRTINTVAGVSDEQLNSLGEGMRSLSRTTGASLDDITAGFYDLVSAGVAAADAQGVLTAAVNLSIGGLSTTQESIDLLTTAINSYGLATSEATHISDVFAETIALGKVTAAELAGSFAQVAPLASAAGISIEELAAGYATLTAKGVPASEASTDMRAAIIALERPTAALSTIQKDLGVNFLEVAKEKGLVVAYQQLADAAAAAGVPLIKLTGRIEGTQFALATTGDALATYNRNLQLVTDSTGVAAAQMQEREKGLNAALDRLRANAHDAGITIGSALLPPLADLANQLNEKLADPNTQRMIQDLGKALAGALGGLEEFATKLPWDAIGDAFTIVGEGSKALLTAFLGLPPWVQTAVLTGWGLNKLTGGALGNIVGILGSGLIKGVLGMNAGVVNINAAVVNGPGGGLPTGPTTPTPTGTNWKQIISDVLKGAVAVVGGFAVGSFLGSPEHERIVAPARTFETGVVNDLLTSDKTSREDIVHAIDTIDDQLATAVADPLGRVAVGADQLASYFTGQPSSVDILAAQRQQLVDALAGITTSSASTFEKSRATAADLNALKLNELQHDAVQRGQNNAILAAANRAAADQAVTANEARNIARYTGIDAAKPPPSFAVTIPVTAVANINVNGFLRTVTSAWIASASGGAGPALDPTKLY